MKRFIRLQAFSTCKVRRKTEDNVRVRNISVSVRPASVVRVLHCTYSTKYETLIFNFFVCCF